MKEIYNKFIPFKGYLAMTVYPFIFIREELKMKYNGTVRNHEHIHAAQQKEMLWILFFVWYSIEYVVKLLMCWMDNHKAYRSISFEQEAFKNELDENYLRTRKRWAWMKYVFKMKKRTSF